MQTKLAAAALFAATVAQAEPLPLIEIIDPSHPSHVEHATMNKDGRKIPVLLKTFGSDSCERAEQFGRGMAPMFYNVQEFDRMAINRAREIYRTPFDIKAFDEIARKAYGEAMAGFRTEAVQ